MPTGEWAALHDKRGRLLNEVDTTLNAAKAEGRELTEDERSHVQGKMDAIDSIDRDLALIERVRNAGATHGQPAQIAGPQIHQIHDRAEDQAWGSLGEQLMAVRNAALPGGAVDPRLLRPMAIPLGANVGQPSDGGFLLQPDYTAGIWQKSYEMGQILSRCFRVPIGDNADSVKINGIDEDSRTTGSRWGGVQAYWIAEAGTLTGSQPHFKQIELAPKKMAVLVYATSEMLRNPTTLEAVINQVVPQEITFTAEDAIFRGDGKGKPQGIIASTGRVTQAAEGGQPPATLQSENIIKMWSRCFGRSRQTAVWLTNQDIEPQLFTVGIMIGVGGSTIYMPPGGLSAQPYGTLFGRPVIPVEYASTLGTEGDIVLADLSQYAISDRGNVRADSSIHVQFLTDQTAFRFIYEIDGTPLWSAPLTPYQGVAATTLSPFVTLATR